MSQAAPLFEIALDASELPWSESYAAIFAQVVYHDPEGKTFSANALLSEDTPKGVIRSDAITREITDPYAIFFIYLIYRPWSNRKAAKAQALKALAALPAQGPDAEATALAQIKRVLSKTPLDFFVGPTQMINATSVVVPPALPTAKLKLEFLADAVIDGKPVTARYVSLMINLRTRPDADVAAVAPMITLPDFERPTLYELSPARPDALVELYRDERSFVLELDVAYRIDAGKHSNTWINRPTQTVSPMIPALYLRPDLDAFTLTLDGSQIDWQGADPVVLVLVNAQLHAPPPTKGEPPMQDRIFSTVTFDPAGPFQFLRSINLPANEVPTITWSAYYYYKSGRSEEIGNPKGKPLTGRQLVLPPNGTATPSPALSAFVLETVGAASA